MNKKKLYLVMNRFSQHPCGIMSNCQAKLCTFPNGFKKGIMMVSDVLDPVGTFSPVEKLKDIYLMRNVGPLNYIRAGTVVTKYINNNKYKQGENVKVKL